MRTPRRLFAIIVLAIAVVSSPLAQQQADTRTPLQAQIDRIFKDRAYDAPRFGPARWLADGSAYAIVERTGGASEIARYDAASGARARSSTSTITRGRATASSCWSSPTPERCGGRTRAAITT